MKNEKTIRYVKNRIMETVEAGLRYARTYENKPKSLSHFTLKWLYNNCGPSDISISNFFFQYCKLINSNMVLVKHRSNLLDSKL